MKLTVEQFNDDHGAIIQLMDDNLDAGNVKSFRDAIKPVLETHDQVLVDMSRLEFVDSSGLGALLSSLRSMNDKNGQFKLYGMTKPVQALFELVRMHRIFAIYETRDNALSAC